MKRLSFWGFLSILALAAALMVITSGNAAANTYPSCLVGYWKAENNTDDSADTNDGTLDGSYASGRYGQAFFLNGTTNYVDIPESGVQLDGFTALTIDAWINPNALATGVEPNTTSMIVSKYNSSGPANVSYYLNIVKIGNISGYLRMAVFTTVTPNNFVYITSDAPVIMMGSFRHVAGVWNGGTNFALYVDGALVPATVTTTGTLTNMANNNTNVNIGRLAYATSYSGPGHYFSGLIDEVRIWNCALSADQIKKIYGKVDIDIKPGSFPNGINLGEQGLLPVAILGSSLIPVTDIDASTIQLGGSSIASRGSIKKPKLAYSYEDVNGDGVLDLVAHFSVPAMVESGALTETSNSLELTATLTDGTTIFGSDSVRIVPPTGP